MLPLTAQDELFDNLFRPHLAGLVAYSSARSEFSGKAAVYLDANENALGPALPGPAPLHRYPDPKAAALRARMAQTRGLNADQVFVGHGSDEAIELLIRVCCRPGLDSILITPPTYGMYEVSAEIDDVAVQRVPLREDFSLDVEAVVRTLLPTSKIVFLCSPNNPTANLMDPQGVEQILVAAPGLVVLDEAYWDFARAFSWTERLIHHPRLVVLQTLSKAWGLAGIRVGFAFGHARVVAMLDKVKPPYNLSQPTQAMALEALQERGEAHSEAVEELLKQRDWLAAGLTDLSKVEKVFPSSANFLLVRLPRAREAYLRLREQGIVVRDRSQVQLCQDCLRITVGTADENKRLLEALKLFLG